MDENVSTIEDKLLETIEALGIFDIVDSAGRPDPAEDSPLMYPAASVLLWDEKTQGVGSRRVTRLEYSVFVSVKNLVSEKDAAKDAYALTDQVIDAIDAQSLGFQSIEPLAFESRTLSGYTDGIITYQLIFSTILQGKVRVDNG